MPDISIAMATFNGEEHIADQLESLADQSYLPAELIVCDDGSTDRTLAIVEDFARSAPFKVLIIINERNLGAIDNFFEAVKYCSGDWICFCDQDDYWRPNKISLAVREILRRPASNLILQRAQLADAKLESLGAPFPDDRRSGYYESNELDLFFEWHGFLQTVRADIFSTFDYNARPINRYRSFDIQSHDQWTCMMSNAVGGVSILPELVALYRRHPKTVTGSYERRKVSLRHRVTSKPSIEQLSWQAIVCESYASYLALQGAEATDARLAKKLDKARMDYELQSEILRLRAELYQGRSWSSRLSSLWGLVLLGGYLRKSRSSIGAKAFVRDAIHALV
jgi:glycosyltransferase involved in cell wall biosynthesis